MNTTTQQEILRLETQVQQLANEMHRAKRRLDWDTYTWAGLAHIDPRVRANIKRNWRFFPNSEMKLEIENSARAYRKVRKKYMVAKGQLDELKREERNRGAISNAREHMKEKFRPRIAEIAKTSLMKTNAGGLDLSQCPELVKMLDDSVNEAVKEMKAKPSQASVLATVETLAAAMEIGYDSVRPGKSSSANTAIIQVAKNLLKNAENKYNPEIPRQRKQLLKFQALLQYLNG